MKHTLTLYTQPNCMYCEMMKSKLDRWGYKYEIVNIQLDEQAKAFIVLDEGHKTVPQLYYGHANVNSGVDTEEYTKEMLSKSIERISG